MNKYARALIHVPMGVLKMCVAKILHPGSFRGPVVCAISPLTEISLDRGSSLHIGSKFRMRDGAKLRVRRGAVCRIGKDVSLNSNNIIACRQSVTIGNHVQFSPNVQIYDHDHDFRVPGGVGEMKYRTTPVVIGNSCWIGANTVILRGSILGDNCVVAAGSIVKGEFPANSLIVQKHETSVKQIVIE